jgi:phosphoenolpyruvate synthase/pyruvate phosphate dikinase
MLKIINFSDITQDSQRLVGGKGYSLGMMIQNGIPVPDGFAVTTEVFDLFSSLNKIDSDTEKLILSYFDRLNCEFVAVRSSANCEDGSENSFAGQFDSYLNTSRDNLIKNITKCWDSLNSTRCNEYLDSKNIDKNTVKVAVVIQKMIQSEVAGVAFTINPVTNNPDQTIIEAAYGLGEAVVSGQVTPDHYVWDKVSGKIKIKDIVVQEKGLFISNKYTNTWKQISKNNQANQKLGDAQIIDLIELCGAIKNYYNHECDIEWAFADDQLYITQSRPVTTLEQSDVYIETYEETEKILPYLAIPLVNTTNGLEKYKLANYTKLGMNYKDDYLYPLMLKNEANVVSESVVNRIFEDRNFVPAVVLDIQEQKEVLAELVFKVGKIDTLDTNQLIVLLKQIQSELQIFWGFVWKFIATDFPNECLSIRLRKILKSEGFGVSDTNEIIAVFSSPDLSSLKLGKYHKSLLKHGPADHVKDEFAWIHWNYDEGLVLDEHLMNKVIEHAKQLGLNPVIKNIEIQDCIQKYSISATAKVILHDVLNMAQVKADAKEVINEIAYLSQILFKELENKLDIPADALKFLLPEELELIESKDENLIQKLKSRKSQQCIVLIVGGQISVVQGDDIKNVVIHKEKAISQKADSVVLSGNCAYKGKITGRVCIIKGDGQAKTKEFIPGSILVSVNTSPNMLSVMSQAIGIITDIGGITSHAAIVARELKIPCITGTKVATQTLKDGDLIELDADSGEVRVLNKL